MNAKRQAAMVKSVAKNMRAKERQQAENEKKTSAMYAVLHKVGKSLDEVTKDDLTKKEYQIIVEFITVVRGWNITLYPNLQ